jgi:hypothetical protein
LKNDIKFYKEKYLNEGYSLIGELEGKFCLLGISRNKSTKPLLEIVNIPIYGEEKRFVFTEGEVNIMKNLIELAKDGT